ncbi:hypothetical protein [Enterococcus canintestini]|uniref:hypothetical protein n=1 Tax=Enterococcus canintestini TaxID=317010 RepID=UPI00288D9907|nr:hypothetical protein [Enterococcus canintestini]MDT2739248.1 hypothetical protein [Enterococcus canintestini]
MINFTFENYLQQDSAMRIDEALEIYNGIMGQADKEDEDFRTLWEDLIDEASKYVIVRSKWALQTQDERISVNASRSAQHNAYMSTLEPMIRYVYKKSDQDFEWGNLLGDRKKNRKRWGDFAGYLLLFNTLGNR